MFVYPHTFIKPQDVWTLGGIDDAIKFLERAGVQDGLEAKAKYILDLQNGRDARFGIGTYLSCFGLPTVFMRTVTARTTYKYRANKAGTRGWLWYNRRLKEFKLSTGAIVARRHADSSFSEKAWFADEGRNLDDEQPEETIIRGFWEEMGMFLNMSDLTKDRLKPYPNGMRNLSSSLTTVPLPGMDREEWSKSNVELDIRTWGKIPEIMLHNELVHFVLQLRQKRYNPDGYVNENRQSVHVWEDSGASLTPLEELDAIIRAMKSRPLMG